MSGVWEAMGPLCEPRGTRGPFESDAGVVSVIAEGRQRHYQVEWQKLGDVLALWLRSIGFVLQPSIATT